MGENILILSASVGAGHLRAAEAVELALCQIAPKANVKNVDVLTLANKTFRRIYGQAYLDFVNHAPYVLGYFYDLFDRPRPDDSRSDRFRIATKTLRRSLLAIGFHHRLVGGSNAFDGGRGREHEQGHHRHDESVCLMHDHLSLFLLRSRVLRAFSMGLERTRHP